MDIQISFVGFTMRHAKKDLSLANWLQHVRTSWPLGVLCTKMFLHLVDVIPIHPLVFYIYNYTVVLLTSLYITHNTYYFGNTKELDIHVHDVHAHVEVSRIRPQTHMVLTCAFLSLGPQEGFVQ